MKLQRSRISRTFKCNEEDYELDYCDWCNAEDVAELEAKCAGLEALNAELLEAAYEMLNMIFHGDWDIQDVKAHLRAAIAKAERQQP